HGQRLHAIEDAVPEAHEAGPFVGIRRELAHRLEVGARAEGAAGRGEGDDAHRRVSLHRRAHRVEILEQTGADGVELVGPVENDTRDAVLGRVGDGAEIHGLSSGPVTPRRRVTSWYPRRSRTGSGP